MASTDEFEPANGCRISTTGRTARVAHRDDGARNDNLGITHRCRVVAVHAVRIRAALGGVGAVEAAEPVHAPGRALLQPFAEYLAARLLGTGFVETGGNPRVCLPSVIAAFELLQIPAPLDDGLVGEEYADETKWIYSGERQLCERRIRESM